MKPLVEIDKEMNQGITPSVDLNDVLFWEDGGNIAFRRDALTPLTPHVQAFAKPEAVPIRGVFECIIDRQAHIFFGTQTKLYRWTEAAGVVDVTRAGGNYNGRVDAGSEIHPVFLTPSTHIATVWHFSQFGRWVTATNGRDVPQLYKPEAGVFRNLDTQNATNLTFQTCELMLPFKNFMFALNTTPLTTTGNGGEAFVHFSELDDIEKWDPTIPTNKYASDLPIRDADGPIIASLVTDDALMFVTGYGMHAVTFIGAPLFFGHQKLLNGMGALSKQCFVADGRLFYGAGPQGIWRSDGVQIQYIDEPVIHKYVYDDLNFDQASKCVLWRNFCEEMIEFHYPSKDSIEIDKAVGFNYRDSNWTIIDRVRSSGTVNSVFTFGVTATKHGEVAFQNTGAILTGNMDNVIGGVDSRGGLDSMPFEMEERCDGILSGFGDGGFGMGGFGGLARKL